MMQNDSLTDVMVVTPLDEEWRTYRKALGGKLRERPISSVVYYLSTLGMSGSGPLRSVVGASMGEMGIGAAGIFATTALELWKPAVVVLLGIAGSLNRKDIRLGDVVVSTDVYGYEVSSVRGRINRFEFRKTCDVSSPALLARLRAIRNDERVYREWQNECLGALEPPLRRTARPPEMHFEITASGNSVVKSTTFVKTLRQQIDPRIAAVEMEGKGLFGAVAKAGSSAKAVMIRGISDYANGRKSSLDKASKGAWRRAATSNATRLLRRLLESELLEFPAKARVEMRLDDTPTVMRRHGLLLDRKGAQNFVFQLLNLPSVPIALDVRVVAFRGTTPVKPARSVCGVMGDDRTVLLSRCDDSDTPDVSRFSLTRNDRVDSSNVTLMLAFDRDELNPVDRIEVTCRDEFDRQLSHRWRA